MNIFLKISLFILSFNACYAKTEDLKTKEYQTFKIATSLTLPKLPLNLDPHFFRRPEVTGIPRMDDFLRKGFLVRTCTLSLSTDWNGVVPISHRRPCSYWTLNSIVPVDYSDNFNNNSAVVISPFAKRWRNIISISFPEVMVAGDVTLGDGDILVLNRSKHKFLYNDEIFRENCARKGILVTFYEGPSDYWQRIDLNKEPPLNEPRRIVRTLLKEMGGWTVEIPLGFWTPTTPAKVDGKQVHPFCFFGNFLKEAPASFGSDYYSSQGCAHLLSKANSVLSTDPNTLLYPMYFNALKKSLQIEFRLYFGKFKFFDELAQSAVRKFFDTKPTDDVMDTRLKISQQVEKTALAEKVFIEFMSKIISVLPKEFYDRLKLVAPNIPKEQTETLDTMFAFSKWAQSFSPAFVFVDQLATSVTLPASINQPILRKLPLQTKITIFEHIFQLYHDRGLIDVDQAIKMFDDPVGFFRKLHKLQ